MDKKERFSYIDFLKGISILAVILDHTFGLIYKCERLHLYFGFSVTLFVFLGGITSSISISKRTDLDFNYILRRVMNILIPYCFATFVYSIYFNNYKFNFLLFKQQLESFSAAGPLYFVLFYTQLITISTFLYTIFKKCKSNIFKEIFLLILIYFVSKYLKSNTIMGNIYGGSGNLLGGTYLFVFCLGIVFYMNVSYFKSKVNNIISLIILLLSLIIFEKYDIIKIIWSNPPNKFLIIYSLIIFGIVYNIYNISNDKVKNIFKFFKVINILGENSLYIFLYHFLFLHLCVDYNLINMIFVNTKNNILVNILNDIWILLCTIIPPIFISKVNKKYLKPYFIATFLAKDIV